MKVKKTMKEREIDHQQKADKNTLIFYRFPLLSFAFCRLPLSFAYRSLLLTALLCLSLTSYHLPLLFSARSVGTTGAQFLRMGAGSRSTAMGNAFTSVGEGGIIESQWNPAGLTGSVRQEFSFVHFQHILGVHSSYVGYAYPFTKKSVMGVGALYGAYGQIEETRVSVGKDEGTKTGASYGASDAAVTLTFSQKFMDQLSAGINVRYLRQSLSNVAVQGYSMDIGSIYRIPGSRFNLGISLKNIGPGMQFARDSSPLPFTFAAGFSSTILSKTLLFSADFEKVQDADWSARFGWEYSIYQRFTLRSGYNGLKDTGSAFSFGAGFKMGHYSLDYAFIPFGFLGESHRISATVRFGQSK